MLGDWLFLLIGFVFLVKGADFLVDGSSNFARKMGVSSLVVGLTVVAFGTSLPELIVNIFSILNGSTDMALGNILGSNLANLLLVLGLAGAVGGPLIIKSSTTWKEIPFSFLASIVFFIIVNDIILGNSSKNIITTYDGLLLLCLFSIFMYYVISMALEETKSKKQLKNNFGQNLENSNEDVNSTSSIKDFVFIVLGILGLYLGGNWIVKSSISISRALGMSEILISATVIALGTSLPEIVTSIVAIMKKQADLAVGNVIGSNIFNTLFVLGISALISDLEFKSILFFDLILLIIANFFLFIFMFTGKYKRLDKWEAYLLLGIYTFYISYMVVRG